MLTVFGTNQNLAGTIGKEILAKYTKNTLIKQADFHTPLYVPTSQEGKCSPNGSVVLNESIVLYYEWNF